MPFNNTIRYSHNKSSFSTFTRSMNGFLKERLCHCSIVGFICSSKHVCMSFFQAAEERYSTVQIHTDFHYVCFFIYVFKDKEWQSIVQTEVSRVILDALAHPALLPNVAPNKHRGVCQRPSHVCQPLEFLVSQMFQIQQVTYILMTKAKAWKTYKLKLCPKQETCKLYIFLMHFVN